MAGTALTSDSWEKPPEQETFVIVPFHPEFGYNVVEIIGNSEVCMIAINRLNDYVFKRIFGVEENKDILIDFLNSIILTDINGPLTDIELEDRELDPEFFGDKASRLDILATAQNGTRINIEVQIVNISEQRPRQSTGENNHERTRDKESPDHRRN